MGLTDAEMQGKLKKRKKYGILDFLRYFGLIRGAFDAQFFHTVLKGCRFNA